MIEVLFIIAIGALILLYAQRQSDKKTIERLDYNFPDMRDEPMQKMRLKHKSCEIGITYIFTINHKDRY